MVEDKILLLLKDLTRVKEELKEVKKQIRDEEKIDVEEYLHLKKSLKDLRAQVKEYEDDYLDDLKTDEAYNELREIRLKKEEEVAQIKEKMFAEISKLPQKHVALKTELDEGFVKIDIVPEMRVYLNGKEEKQ